MRFRLVLVTLALLMGFAGQAAWAATLTAEEAKNHVGENATVCGLVANTR